MKLETIEVKNYRSLFQVSTADSPFTLHLGDGINAITGPNNVGKSNVFRALCLALDPDFTFNRALDMPTALTWAKPSVTLSFRLTSDRGREGTLARKAEAYERAVNPDLRTSFAEEGVVKLRVTIEGSSDEIGNRRQVLVAKGAGARSLPDDHPVAMAAIDQFHKCLHFVMVSSGQSLESLMEGKFRDILHNVLKEELRSEFAQAEASRQRYEDSLRAELLNPLAERISAEVGDLFPEIGAVTLRPRVLDLDQTLAGMRIDVSDAAITDLADKGTGVRGGLIVAMLRHFADVGRRSMLFAVEEPESFLHPAAQEVLREDLEALSERPDVSLLVTTHSPYIVSRQPDAKTFALGKDQSGRTCLEAEAFGDEAHAGVLRGLFRDRLLAEWLDRSLSSSADARLVLVVEGETDVAFAKLALERAGRTDLLEGIEFRLPPPGHPGGAYVAVQEALLARALHGDDVVVAALFDNDSVGIHCIQTLKDVGEKTRHWRKARTLFSYLDAFDPSLAEFAFEAEDLWPSHLHESFKAVCPDANWLVKEERIPNPVGGRQYSWAIEAKGPLMEHLTAKVTAADCARWVSFYEHIRRCTRIDDKLVPARAPGQTRPDEVAVVPAMAPAKEAPEPTASGSRPGIDELGARARELGLGKQFDALLDVTDRVGLGHRASKNGVMVTSPDHRNRFLLWIEIKQTRSPYLRVSVGTDRLAELFRVPDDRALDLLGGNLNVHTGDSVAGLVEGIEALAAEGDIARQVTPRSPKSTTPNPSGPHSPARRAGS